MIDNLKSQMRKGILEYCVLTILNDQESYTAEIIECLQAANLIVVEGTIYPLLTRMKNAQLLTYRWQESTEGPPRKYFHITDKGKELLAELDKEWTAISQSVGKITVDS